MSNKTYDFNRKAKSDDLEKLIDQVKSININKDPRGKEKPSDHTPIEIELA